ncbi:MAG: HPr family phosphocarrier protein [Anaerolineales bacterium]|jgi:phosphotransferase system HPr (HPr) family protein
MPEVKVKVMHEVGLHARPAALFVQTAKRFNADISVKNGGQEVDAKSILSILTLGVSQGTEISISALGDDAEQALNALKTLIENNFIE